MAETERTASFTAGIAGGLTAEEPRRDPAPETVAAELAQISRTGVAAERDEAVLGESSLAAPVFNATALAVSAVSVVIPSSEWPPPDSVHDDLREAARNVTRELGASGWPVHAEARPPRSAPQA